MAAERIPVNPLRRSGTRPFIGTVTTLPSGPDRPTHERGAGWTRGARAYGYEGEPGSGARRGAGPAASV